MDVSQLPAIQEIGRIDPPGFVPLDAAYFGNYSVLSGVLDAAVDPPGPRPGMLVVVDIANSSQPSEIARIDGLGQDAMDIEIQNNKAFIAAGSLFVVDLVSAAFPSIIAEIPCEGAQEVCLSGTLAYVACGDGGLVIVDISAPSLPRLIGHAVVPSGAHAVAVSRGRAYVASHGAGLHVFDVMVPSRPRRIGGNGAVGDLCDIAIRRNSLFATGCDWNQGWLFVYDISNPISPAIIEGVAASGFPGRLALSVSNLFLAGWESIAAYELIPCSGHQLPGNPILSQ